MKRFLVLFLIMTFAVNLSAQKDKKKPASGGDPNFKIEELPKVLLVEMNQFRKSKGLDTLEFNEMLNDVAYYSSDKQIGETQPKVVPKKTQKMLKKAGGTKKGEEVIMKAPVSKGKESYKTDEVAKIIYTRWQNNKKDLPIVLNPKYVMCGIGCTVSDDGKKVVASMVLSGYDIDNKGAVNKKELAVPYNTKSKKLKDPDQKACKNCDKWKNYDNLQKGLYVENGKVYLKYNNLKELKRLLKKSKDGFAVDIVQRAQYEKPDYNIMDNNLYNKGVMTNIIYKDKFFKKNRIKPDPKAKKKIKINKVDVEMGKFDPKITGPYELNLIVVQDGKVCRTVTRTYVEKGDVESSTPIGILPFPDTKGLKPPFEPRSESSLINFTIPFAKNKSEFKDEDIAPLVAALNEPDFIIDGLYIYAYSSIEGDSVANAKLQRKRAESVSNVLQNKQAVKVKPLIETKDSWGLFMLENEDGKYADLVALGKKGAITKINGDKKLVEELEPILAKERFAQTIMDVTYDISGNKEQKFTQVSFNRALKNDKVNNAYKMMEFAHQRVMEKKYSPGAIDSLQIPDEPKYLALFNNRVHYRFLANNNSVDEDDYTEIDRLNKIDPSNEILRYNRMYCAIKLDSNIGSTEAQAKMQADIDELYKTKIEKRLLDGLNIEWQFKLIDYYDTSDNPASLAAIDACIERIKSFYDLKGASWQNAQKLASVFSRAKDYRYASTIMEPYVTSDDVDENLLFTYISIASHLPEKFYSHAFSNAISLARKKNPERYCKLFGEPYMTFQVFDNPHIKKEYNGANCK